MTQNSTPISSDFNFRYRKILRDHRKISKIFAGTLLGVMALGAFIVKPSYKASTSLIAHVENLTTEWDILRRETQDTDFEEQVLSRTVLEPVLKDFKLFPGKKDNEKISATEISSAVKAFQKKIHAERLKHSTILEITATDHTPEKAAEYSNAVARSFIRYMKNKQRARLQQILNATEFQIKAIPELLQTKANSRKKFLTAHKWDDYYADLQSTKAQVGALKNSLRFLETYEKNKGTASNSRPQPAELGYGIESDPALTEMTQRLNTADTRLNDVASRHSSDNLGVLQARLEKEWAQNLFEKQAGNIEDRKARLQKQLAIQQQQLQELMIWEPQARTLDAEITHLEQQFQELLKEKSKLDFALSELNQSPDDEFAQFQILDDALPAQGQNPWTRILSILGIAVILSFLGYYLSPLLFELLEFQPSAGSLDITPVKEAENHQAAAHKTLRTSSMYLRHAEKAEALSEEDKTSFSSLKNYPTPFMKGVPHHERTD